MVIKAIINTEKTIKLIEDDNILTLEVELSANKDAIKKAVEKKFNVKVDNVNTLISNNKKKAYVKINKDFKAIDIANKYGVL